MDPEARALLYDIQQAQALVERFTRALSRLMASCHAVEQAAARAQAAVKPGAKPTVLELAAGILASKRHLRNRQKPADILALKALLFGVGIASWWTCERW